ncbi:MAG: nucleotidyltransferase domain-containing protein [Clostridiales bacterium]|nr:nucleotidyltransferase domain-containing protein [Clostridiales bacterium]
MTILQNNLIIKQIKDIIMVESGIRRCLILPSFEHNLVDILSPVLQKYKVNTIYLFGSRSEGTSYTTSDYDFAFLFKNFNQKKHNHSLAVNIQMKIEEILAPVPVDVVFLQNTPVELRFQIIKYGKIMYCSDENFRTDFEDITIRDYLDFKPFIDEYRRELEESIREGNFFVKP